MKRKFGTKITAAVLSCCLVVPMSISSVCASQIAEPEDIAVSTSEIVPFSKYLRAYGISFTAAKNIMYVDITTKAFQNVDHIYHDVTIFKNGVLYSSQRYNDYNTSSLTTTIKVNATSGDYIDVYADHYAAHGGVVESKSNSNSQYY